MLLATHQKPMVFSTVHTPPCQPGLGCYDRFKLGLSYIHSYFTGDDVNLTGSTGSGFAQEPLAKLRLQAFLWSASELPVQPWPDLLVGVVTLTFLKMELRQASSSGDNAEIWNYAVSLAYQILGKKVACWVWWLGCRQSRWQ